MLTVLETSNETQTPVNTHESMLNAPLDIGMNILQRHQLLFQQTPPIGYFLTQRKLSMRKQILKLKFNRLIGKIKSAGK